MTEALEDLLFDLNLTDEQRMNRETMQRFAAAEIRDLSLLVDTGERPAGEFFPKTTELGLTLLQIPEALGGAGVPRSPVANALIMEDLAHGDLSLALGAVSPLGFVNTNLNVAYRTSGSFVRFCIDTYGPEKVTRWFGSEFVPGE